MGAAASTVSTEQTTKIVNEAILNTMVKFADQCGATSTTVQKISLRGAKVGNMINSFNQRATVSIDLNCMQESVSQQELQDSLQSAIAQAVTSAAGSSPTLGFNASTNFSKTIAEQSNKVARTVSIESVKTCMAQMLTAQELDFENAEIGTAIGSANQVVTADIVAKCIQNSSTTQKAILDLSNKVKQDTEASATAGIGTAGIVIAILVICCISCIASSVFSMTGGGGESGESGVGGGGGGGDGAPAAPGAAAPAGTTDTIKAFATNFAKKAAAAVSSKMSGGGLGGMGAMGGMGGGMGGMGGLGALGVL